MLIAHRIAIDLNNVQATYMARAAGTARFAYNWALAEWKRQYEAWKLDNSLPKPTQAALRRQLNSIKREQFPWMLEVTKNAPQMAIIQLGQAFQNFFAGRAKYPQFRKKGVHDRFTLTNDQFSIDGCRIRIPNLGWVRMRETLRFAGKIMSATISRVADRWFVSLTVDTPDSSHLPKAENQGAVGVDLGVSALATLSTGEVIDGPKAHKVLLNRLQRLSRSLSRKQKLGQPQEGQRQSGNTARPYCGDSQQCPAPTHDKSDAPVPHHRHRGFERARDGKEPSLGSPHRRHGILRVASATGVQGKDAWRAGRCCGSLLSEQQNMFGLRTQAR